MSYYDFCAYRFSLEQLDRMATFYLYFPAYKPILDAPNECLLPKHGKILRNCVDVPNAQASLSPIISLPVEVRDVSPTICNSQNNLTNSSGDFLTEPCVLSSSGRRVLPSKNYLDELNGVSTYDLVLISNHILGIDPFENPFQVIAGDANNSGSLTTIDIVEIRKAILFYPNYHMSAGSWRYVPKLCLESTAFNTQFYADQDTTTPGIQPNPFPVTFQDPFQGFIRRYKSAGTTIPNNDSWMDFASLNTDQAPSHNENAWSFVGVKVGDINCNGSVSGITSPDNPNLSFTTVSHSPIAANQIFYLQVKAAGNASVGGWQFGVDFAEDSLQILEAQAGNSGQLFSIDKFGLADVSHGKFRALNYSEDGLGKNLDNKSLFVLKMRALQPISNIGQRFRLSNSVLTEGFCTITGKEIEPLGLQLVVTSSGPIGMLSGNGPIDLTEDSYNLSAYPVPFTSEVAFDFLLPENEKVQLSLFDSFGHLVAQHNEDLYKGANTVQISDLANQPAGLYLYSFIAGSKRIFGKISKN